MGKVRNARFNFPSTWAVAWLLLSTLPFTPFQRNSSADHPLCAVGCGGSLSPGPQGFPSLARQMRQGSTQVNFSLTRCQFASPDLCRRPQPEPPPRVLKRARRSRPPSQVTSLLSSNHPAVKLRAHMARQRRRIPALLWEPKKGICARHIRALCTLFIARGYCVKYFALSIQWRVSSAKKH